MERLSWWLKTHTGVGTQLELQTCAMIHSSTDSERGQVCQVGCARGTRLVQGPWLLHTGPVLPSVVTTPLMSLEGPELFCFCAFFPTTVASWAETVSGFVLFPLYIETERGPPPSWSDGYSELFLSLWTISLISPCSGSEGSHSTLI